MVTFCSGRQLPSGGSGGIGAPSLRLSSVTCSRWGRDLWMILAVSSALVMVDEMRVAYGRFNSFSLTPVSSACDLPGGYRMLHLTWCPARSSTSIFLSHKMLYCSSPQVTLALSCHQSPQRDWNNLRWHKQTRNGQSLISSASGFKEWLSVQVKEF